MKEANRLRCLQESDPDDQAENVTQQEEPTPAPLSFPGDFQESVERGRVWEVVLIRSGWSNNGVYYAPEALQEAVGLFHGVPIASYKLGPKPDGHLPRNLREARTEAPAGNVVGLATDPRVVPFPGGVEIRGQFHCTDPQVRATLLAAEAAGAPYPLGLSIDANGVANPGMAEGRQGVICTKLIELLETTMVARPAAGGRVVRLETERATANPFVPSSAATEPDTARASGDTIQPGTFLAFGNILSLFDTRHQGSGFGFESWCYFNVTSKRCQLR